jgi:hypothetical protein
MKPHPLLLSLLILSTAILHVQAQTAVPPTQAQAAVPATQAKKAKAPAEASPPKFLTVVDSRNEKTATVGVDRDGSVLLTVNPGTLEAIVTQLETVAPEMANKGRDPWAQMPNIVFGPGAQEAEVPTTMRLRQVTPVQALALVAAAAGCTLQPISAPVEAGSGQPLPPVSPFPSGPGLGGDEYKIIGYRFEVVEKPVPATRSTTVPARSPQAASPSDLITAPRREPSSAPPQRMLSIVGVNPNGPFVMERELPAHPNQIASKAEPNVNFTGEGDITLRNAFQSGAAKTDEPSVRVYAVGAFLRGTPDEMKDKQDQLTALIGSGLNLATPAAQDGPNLSFHTGTKTLIVKATAAQHDVISQIITALKENEAADSAVKR